MTMSSLKPLKACSGGTMPTITAAMSATAATKSYRQRPHANSAIITKIIVKARIWGSVIPTTGPVAPKMVCGRA